MDKSFRTKYAERLNKKQFTPKCQGSKPSGCTKGNGNDGTSARAEAPGLARPSSKYFNSAYVEKKNKEVQDNLTKILREKHERDMKHLHTRFSNYVDHYFGLMQLKDKLYQLRAERRRMDLLFNLEPDPFDDDDDLSDEHDALFGDSLFDRFGYGQKKNPKKCSPRNGCGVDNKKNSKSCTAFQVYNEYKDHTAELDLENGLFSIQIDVGGSKDNEVLVDSEENHLTVKSKDSAGQRHTFGIICPNVDDIDKLHIHHPKDGLLVIDGPLKGKKKGQSKKARTVHM